MTIQEKLTLLEETFDVDTGTLTPEMNLKDIEEYDSLTKLSIMAMMGSTFKKTISPDVIKNFDTINDILSIMEE